MTSAQYQAICKVTDEARERILSEAKASFAKTSDGKRVKALKAKIKRLEETQSKLEKEIDFILKGYEYVYSYKGGSYVTPNMKARLNKVEQLHEDLKTKLAFSGKHQGEAFMAFMKAIETV